jgi:hypothetical protein
MAYTDYVGRTYHEEIDLSFFIEGLGVTRTGMVGTAAWGPMNEATLVTSEEAFKQLFGKPVADSNSYQCARAYFQRGNQLVFVRVGAGTEAQAFAVAAQGGGTGTAPTFKAKHPGTEGNDITLSITQGTLGASYYKIEVLKATLSIGEVYDNILAVAGTDVASRLLESDYIVATNGNAGSAVLNVPQTVTLVGGLDGIAAIAAANYVGTTGATTTGLQLFRAASHIDIDMLVCPNYKDATTVQALHETVYAELVAIAAERQDIIAILDPPSGCTANYDSVLVVGPPAYPASTGIDQYWRGTALTTAGTPNAGNHDISVNSSFCANYFPWITVTDYYNSLADLSLPPGPACAGAISYSDSVSYPWWAPAGTNRGMLSPLVKGVAYPILDSELTTLQSDLTMGVTNPILYYNPNYYMMGQKTMLRSNSMLSRINTRRMVNKFRKQAVTALGVLQFEPNDEYTWRQYTALLNPYLDYLKSTEGLLGYTTAIGQGTTMTDDDIGAGRMIGNVTLILMPTGEKVVLGYYVTDQGANFSELN